MGKDLEVPVGHIGSAEETRAIQKRMPSCQHSPTLPPKPFLNPDSEHQLPQALLCIQDSGRLLGLRRRTQNPKPFFASGLCAISAGTKGSTRSPKTLNPLESFSALHL